MRNINYFLFYVSEENSYVRAFKYGVILYSLSYMKNHLDILLKWC